MLIDNCFHCSFHYSVWTIWMALQRCIEQLGANIGVGVPIAGDVESFVLCHMYINMHALGRCSTNLLLLLQNTHDGHCIAFARKHHNSAQHPHFPTSFSFQREDDVATLLSAQQVHLQITAIFQQHFQLHFYISLHHASFNSQHAPHASLHLHHHLIESQAFDAGIIKCIHHHHCIHHHSFLLIFYSFLQQIHTIFH